jgi:hypothetical protein
MKKLSFSSVAILGGLLVNAWTIHAATTFSFADFTFDQVNTPDRAVLLGSNAVMGGATFSEALPADVTSVINFPGGTGFNSALCLAPLTGLSSNSVRAINLPLGNDGSNTRHGVEVSWSNGRGILNLTNTDFIVYESGSSSFAVEGVMARARYNNTWSDWYYFPPKTFQSTTGGQGLFCFGFDLSDMAVPANAAVDHIQLANLTQADRIATTNTFDIGGGVLVGEGRVVFDNSSSIYPDAGPMGSTRRFTSTTYDPDPLYVAALQAACELTLPVVSIIRSNANIIVSWPAPSCYSLETTTEFSTTNTVAWGIPVETTVVGNGQNTVTMTLTNSTRFFRLVKP